MLGRVEIDEERAKEHFFKERAKCGERNRLSDEKRLHSFNDRLAELDKLIQSAFEEKVLGNLPESMCKSLFEKYQAEKESVQRQINMLEEQIAAVNEMDAEVEEYIAQLKRYANCEELTREMCLQLIEFITIGERPSDDTPREIHIYYKFISYQTLAEYRGQTTK